MANVGFDFGTTYTSCFRWQDGGDKEDIYKSLLKVQTAISESQPTLALWTGAKWEFGYDASEEFKNNRSDKYRLFKGFKLLLGRMADRDLLKKHGYDSEGDFCPASITENYLRTTLESVSRKLNPEKIEKIIAGYPLIWLDKEISGEALSIYQEVFKKITKEVTPDAVLVFESEPALSCAYFANQYKKTTKGDFKGHILLIDYGGGTLDINLCETNQIGGAIEISIKARTGDGVNDMKESVLGKAGLAYIEYVVKKIIGEKDIAISERHIKELYLEERLMRKKSEIEKEIKRAANNATLRNKLHNTDFIPNFYDGRPLKYGDLQKIFDEKIGKILVGDENEEGELDKIDKQVKEKINRDPKELKSGKSDDFKIVLTGGFCDFYLTENKIRGHYVIANDDDPRITGMQKGEEGLRYTIAYGASLVADGKVKIKRTYPYSLGFGSENGSNVFLAFKFGDEIQFNVPQYVLKNDDGRKEVFWSGTIECIYYDSNGLGSFTPRVPLDRYKDKFQLPRGIDKICHLGFSMDENENLKLCIQHLKQDSKGKLVVDREEKHELTDIYNLLFSGKVEKADESKIRKIKQ